MPSPALVVGLGGTGTLVATYVKKELMETSGGVWPLKEVKVLSFDTDTKQPEIGGQGQIREAGQSTGAVRLANGEFFFTGGNVQALMREVANGKHAHLRNWLLADWYLSTISDKIFNLNEGAGQFRQFGRLAVFKDVATPSNSTIYNTLNDALVKLSRDNPGMTNLQVFVVSSLAGGTGAGMFADVAYLIRKISEQSSVNLKGKMSVRGYLVLPDAFSQTVDQAWLRSMHARAFAAMRENRRFTVNFDYQRGYPMHYQEGNGHPLWHSSLKGKLFDLLYYLDGNGERSRLGATDIKRGLAPAIADAISAAIDKESGPKFASYVANVEAERVSRISRGESSQKTATFGSVGTYTIVFPIYQIVEAWTHDLGLEVLKRLVMPDVTRLDARSGLPSVLLSNANQENPGEDGRTAASKFLRANKPIIYQARDEHGNVNTIQAEPILMFGELARIAEATAKPGSAIVQELTGRTIAEWNPVFSPQGEDKETQRLIKRVENTLNMRLYDKEGKVGTIQASDQMKPKEDPSLGAERVLSEVRNYKARHLGDEDARTGQRSGGIYRTHLSQIAEYNLARFNLYLDTFIQTTLNGSPNRPGAEARGGKIGYLAEFLESLFQLLVRAQETLQHVQQGRREKGESRRNAIADVQTAIQRMQTLSTKKGLIGGPAGDAFQSQQSYLLAESHLVDILQTEAVEDVILETVTRMIDYVASARDAIQTWVQTLATGQEGLYASLLRGRKQADSDRAAEKDIRSRLILSDEKYEKERYESYLATKEGGWVDALLRSLAWETRTKMQGGRPKLEVVLKVLDLDNKNRSLAEQAANDNLALWLGMCRQPFETARRSESVIGYLLTHAVYRDPTKIAELIYEHGGVSLNFNGGNPLPANFLRAHFQNEEEAGHRAYLRSVIQQLAQRSGQRISDSSATPAQTDSASGAAQEASRSAGQEDRFVQFTNSEDRFKFTVIFTQELIELEKISAYDEGKKAYLGDGDQAAKGDRRILHIFPAEVHAAEYESRLPAELKQIMRLFSDDVALQMEDVAQLKLFLMCYVYGLIRRVSEKDKKTGETKLVFKLVMPPEREFDEFGNPTQTEEIWLTNPARKALMLDAVMTFNFVGRDVGHGDNYVREIDYEMVSKTLQREREKDAARRLQDMNFGKQNQDLFASVQAIRDEKQKLEALIELAGIERISERRTQFETEVIPFYAKNLGDPDSQKDYDIASVFLLMLNDEVKAVRQMLKDRIRALRDLGTISKEDLPSNTQSTDDPW